MIWRRLAQVVLVVFVAGLVSATAGEVLHASESAAHLDCAGQSPCPDPGNDGGPCGPTCPCTCCPGHSLAAAFLLVRPVLGAPTSQGLHAAMSHDLHPRNAPFLIFHPPRA